MQIIVPAFLYIINILLIGKLAKNPPSRFRWEGGQQGIKSPVGIIRQKVFYCPEILICLPLWAQSFKLKQVIKWVTYQKENPLYGECVSLAPLGVLFLLAVIIL